MLTLYYLGKIIRRWRKNYPAVKKLCGGGIIIPGGRKWTNFFEKISQCRNLSRSAENTLFHILIHGEAIPYPYTLPKNYLNTLPKLYPILIPYYPIPCLKTLPKLKAILIHCRNYTLTIAETYPISIHGRRTLLGPGHDSAAIAYLNTWSFLHPHPSDQLRLLLLRI